MAPPPVHAYLQEAQPAVTGFGFSHYAFTAPLSISCCTLICTHWHVDRSVWHRTEIPFDIGCINKLGWYMNGVMQGMTIPVRGGTKDGTRTRACVGSSET